MGVVDTRRRTNRPWIYSSSFSRLRCNSGCTRTTRSSNFLTTASLFFSYCWDIARSLASVSLSTVACTLCVFPACCHHEHENRFETHHIGLIRLYVQTLHRPWILVLSGLCNRLSPWSPLSGHPWAFVCGLQGQMNECFGMNGLQRVHTLAWLLNDLLGLFLCLEEGLNVLRLSSLCVRLNQV